jgi:hypothetical protein
MRTVRKYAWVKSFAMSFPVSLQRAGVSSRQASVSIVPVRIVPASSRAHLDMMKSSVYEWILDHPSYSSRAETPLSYLRSLGILVSCRIEEPYNVRMSACKRDLGDLPY